MQQLCGVSIGHLLAQELIQCPDGGHRHDVDLAGRAVKMLGEEGTNVLKIIACSWS